MNRGRVIAALVALTLRSTLRSRTAVLLAVLLPLVLGLLPLILQSGGTPEDDFNLTLLYVLGAGWGMTTLAALVLGCVVGSADIDASRFQLTRVKPVPPTVLWLGQWCGLLCVQLAAACAVTVLTLAVLAAYVPQGFLARPANLTTPAKAVKEQYVALPPGGSASFEFVQEFNQPSTLRISIDPLSGHRSGVDVQVQTAGITTNLMGFGENQLRVPLPRIAHTVELKHLGDQRQPGLLFSANKVAVLQPGPPFWAALLVGGVVLFLVLAVLAALGLTFGCMFSFPVALFTSVMLLVTIFVAPDNPEEFDTSLRVNRAGLMIGRAAHFVSSPLIEVNLFDSLTLGDLAKGRAVGRLALMYLLVLPLGLCVFSAYVLRRREYGGGSM